ncbi:hypothetical protein PG989_000703 [Apiospora arundinis]
MSTYEADSSDESDYDRRMADLKSQLAAMEQQAANKKKAKDALQALTRRIEKQEKLPSHGCGDILVYRYSESTNDLRKDTVSILVFVLLTRYLNKGQIEALAAHTPTLHKASGCLKNQKEFPSTWYENYLRWKKTSPEAASLYFKEVTEAILTADDIGDKRHDGHVNEKLVYHDGGESVRKRRRVASDAQELPNNFNPSIPLPSPVYSLGVTFPNDVNEDALVVIATSQKSVEGLTEYLIPMPPMT